MATSVSTTQLNLRIISIVVFTCICYLSIGLPLAVLPGYIHYQLGYSTFIAGRYRINHPGLPLAVGC